MRIFNLFLWCACTALALRRPRYYFLRTLRGGNNDDTTTGHSSSIRNSSSAYEVRPKLSTKTVNNSTLQRKKKKDKHKRSSNGTKVSATLSTAETESIIGDARTTKEDTILEEEIIKEEPAAKQITDATQENEPVREVSRKQEIVVEETAETEVESRAEADRIVQEITAPESEPETEQEESAKENLKVEEMVVDYVNEENNDLLMQKVEELHVSDETREQKVGTEPNPSNSVVKETAETEIILESKAEADPIVQETVAPVSEPEAARESKQNEAESKSAKKNVVNDMVVEDYDEKNNDLSVQSMESDEISEHEFVQDASEPESEPESEPILGEISNAEQKQVESNMEPIQQPVIQETTATKSNLEQEIPSKEINEKEYDSSIPQIETRINFQAFKSGTKEEVTFPESRPYVPTEAIHPMSAEVAAARALEAEVASTSVPGPARTDAQALAMRSLRRAARAGGVTLLALALAAATTGSPIISAITIGATLGAAFRTLVCLYFSGAFFYLARANRKAASATDSGGTSIPSSPPSQHIASSIPAPVTPF